MKMDVVMSHYREAENWRFVCRGLEANKEEIGIVFVVNDGPWEYQLSVPEGLDIRFLEQEKDGYGAGRAINKGVESVQTPYFAMLAGDFMLAPQSLLKNSLYLDEETLVGGIFKDAFIRGDELEIMGEDARTTKPVIPGNWKMCRGGYLCASAKSFRDVGGYDKAFNAYGYEDYELAVRWFNRFGDESFCLGTGSAFHLQHRNATVKMPSFASLQRFVNSLAANNATYRLAKSRVGETSLEMYEHK